MPARAQPSASRRHYSIDVVDAGGSCPVPGSGPDGAGCVMLDTAYDAYENYRVIRDSGRRSVIDPRKGHTLKGYNPRAEMLRWRKDICGLSYPFPTIRVVSSKGS